MLFVLLAVMRSSPAGAQGSPAEDDAAGSPAPAASPPASQAPPPNPMIVPTATSSTTNDRPARGPAMRERGGRRARAGGTASGVLFLAILVAAMAWYVIKKLRR